MRKALHTLAPVLLALLCFAACSDLRVRGAFLEHPEVCLMVGSDLPFVYDPLNCQLAFSRDRKEFRAHTDNMSDFFVATLSDIPVAGGQRILADLVWTTSREVLTRKNLTLEVVRIEGDQFWLWSNSGRIGLCIRILE